MKNKGTEEEKEKLNYFINEINKIVTEKKTKEIWESILDYESIKYSKFSTGNSDDHFLPLVSILGTIDDDDEKHGKIIHESFDSAMSMNVYIFE
jgi:aromatic ring-opening dioxygenase catalytic subunit (LigB family)